MPRLSKGVQTKSELVAVRMPARLRHGLDVIARANELTTTDAIAFCIRKFLQTTNLRTRGGKPHGNESLEAVAEATWSSDEVERFLDLASLYPELLRDNERHLLSKILASSEFLDPNGIIVAGVRISEDNVRKAWAQLDR